jgi:hypothetical protein
MVAAPVPTGCLSRLRARVRAGTGLAYVLVDAAALAAAVAAFAAWPLLLLQAAAGLGSRLARALHPPEGPGAFR